MVLKNVRQLWYRLWATIFMVMIVGHLSPAWAGPMPATKTGAGAAQPAQLFEVHCVGCHANGGNIIRRGKNLKARALKRYGYDDVASVADIITHGRGVMSAYKDRLTNEEIQTLAAYVLEQAEAGW